ncbi:hypothetical protein [Streptomyces sp. enrichment culture]|uniref:hypothetical protein n=1 Tax=Streptomyces sp. enrichment culture TaxID=1795815 RepID=UPI003F55D9BB
MDLSDRATRMRVNKRFREKGIPAKVCGKCFVAKGHEAFSADKGKPDGRQGRCRSCDAEANARWVLENRERKRASEGSYRARNREKAAAASRHWYWQNRAARSVTKRRYYAANRGQCIDAVRRWREENPDKYRATNQARKARNANVPTEPFTARDLSHDWEDHDLWSCFFCGGSLADGYDVEHFYPKFPDDEETTPAGPHAVWNLVPSCVPCNRGVDGKHSREPWQFLRESLAEQAIDLDACLAVLDGWR